MAREILVLDQDSLIFLKYYASAPIVILGEAQVLTSPSSSLPPIAADEIGAAGIAAIDEGKTSWQIRVIPRVDGEAVEDYEGRVRGKWVGWSDREGARISEWADQIANVRWLDA